jgi:serine/threonine protein kinase
LRHDRLVRFGPYEVVDELARGGMGAVYAVVHTETGARYALKTLLPEAMGDHEERVRFIREARALAQLQHPHLVRVFSAESEGPRPYLVQELLPGGSLQDRILRQGPIPTEEAVGLVLQVADALTLAHSQGILHRDLKPANVLVAEDGSARLADFGLAKRLHGESIRLTKTGQLLGTPAFMAPEQANGLPSDARTDVYGLAAVLHALLSGAPPFSAKSLIGVLSKVLDEAPLPLDDQPRALQRVIQRAMAKQAAQRQPTMQAFAEELRAALGAGPTPSKTPFLILAALLSLSALAAATWLVLREPAPTPTPPPSSSSSSPADKTPSSSPVPAATLAAPQAFAPRQRFQLEGRRPLRLAYSPDARHLVVHREAGAGTIDLVVYDATSGLLVEAPDLSGVSQIAALPRGRFAAGFKTRFLFARESGPTHIEFLQGTLESLAVSPAADGVLVSLERPSALVAYPGVQPHRRLRLPVEGEPYGLVLWIGDSCLAVRSDHARALRIKDGALVQHGEPLELPRFRDATVGMAWGSDVVLLGNGLGRVLAVGLDPEGVPISHQELQLSQGEAPPGQFALGLRAHTARIHTFLEAQDPPHVVSVAQSDRDRSQNGSLARWRRDAKGAWSFAGVVTLDPGQLCVTQGGRAREWIAAAVLRESEAIFIEQQPTERYLSR